MKTYSVRVMEITCHNLNINAQDEQEAKLIAEAMVDDGKSIGWDYSIEADEVVEEVA